MAPKLETSTPPNTPTPIGPYSHIAKVGNSIVIGGLGGVDPETGRVVGSDTRSQATQILRSFDMMLRSVGSDLSHVVHIHVYLKEMSDFDDMNAAYVEVMGQNRPARTVIGARELPKPEFRVLMNLSALTVD